MNRSTFATISALFLLACAAPGSPPQEGAPIGTLQAKLRPGDLPPSGLHALRPPGEDHRDSQPGDDDRGPSGAAGLAGTTGYGISYHGGPVIHGTVNAYYIWYGNWSGNTATTILTDFISTLGGSPYYNINTTYGDSSGSSVVNSIQYGGSVTDSYSQGTSLSDASIQTIVSSHVSQFNGGVTDPNGVYFVLTSADVNETSGFCTQYCGWHTNGTISGTDVKYSFVGNPDRCPSSCEAQTASSPNGNPGADGMASIIAHEFEETASDPDGNAWYDSSGNENADKCAWTFGTEYTVANGSKANMHLGSRDFLIQQNWLNTAPSGGCALSYATTPDFSISASPGSQNVTQGGSVSYTVTVSALNGFTGTVSLSASGLGSGATGSFSPATITTSGTSTFTVSTTTSAATGTFPLTLTGTSSATSHSTGVSLTVSAPGSSLITNGGFESAFTGWTRSGTTSISSTAHSGSSAAQLGSTSPTSGSSSVVQTFTVPSGKSSVTLSFWYNVYCPDTLTYDWATATVKDNTTGTTTTLLPKTCNTSRTWVQVSKTLSSVAGHSLTLTLTSHDDNYPGDATYTLYDDVSAQ